MSTRTVLKNAVASFPCLFEPSGLPGTEPNYSITMLFDKDADLSALKACCDAAIAKKWPDPASRPAKIDLPMKDGDQKLDINGNQRPEFQGKKFCMAKAKVSHPPKVIMQDLQPCMDQTEFYGGCIVNVSVSAYGWNFGGKNGVSLGLNIVQKVGDGEAFGGSVAIEDEFSAI